MPLEGPPDPDAYGTVRLLEALGSIQQHTPLPIVLPETLSAEELAEVAFVAKLLQEGAVTATWTDANILVDPERAEDIAEQVSQAPAFALERDLSLSLGDVTVPLGRYHTMIEKPTVKRSEESGDGVRLFLAPKDGQEGRAEDRVGPIPKLAAEGDST
jgi:hypothetical protein